MGRSWKVYKILGMKALEMVYFDQVSSTLELPSLSEFLLTASELLTLRLSARLVVVSWSHSCDGWATADGVVWLSRALLASGAQCVLVSLWPVPDTAAKILLRAFYSALLQVSLYYYILYNVNYFFIKKSKTFKIKFWLVVLTLWVPEAY